MKFWNITGLILVSFITLTATEPLLQNVYNRDSFTLNGKWHYIVDPYENGFYDYRYTPFDAYKNPERSGAFFVNKKQQTKSDRIEYDFAKSDMLKVPGDWNYQKEKLYYYEGTVWYEKTFDYVKSDRDNRVFVYFGAANYQADVYLNGRKLGVHKGGFTPFNFEITDVLKEEGNFLIVKVDNKRKAAEVPTLNTDWWNFGGLTRDVDIIEVPANFITDYKIQLAKGSFDKIKGYVQLNGKYISGKQVIVEIPELDIKEKLKTDQTGRAPLEIRTGDLNLWSPENPCLYDVIISTKSDEISDKIGFRNIAVKGTEIVLNGKPVFLRGVSIHEENPIRGGRAFSMDDARMLLGWAREMGCNYVRLAHYPHNENMVRLADEMGIMVWEENPVYWTIQWENPVTYETAEKQLGEVLSRDKNRASVIIWSMANETPVSDARMKFLKKLRDYTLSVDDTRLISAALEVHWNSENTDIKSIEDPFAEYVDILSFNQYIGWYVGKPDHCNDIIWEISQQKPVIASEFGGGALQGYHGDKMTIWTEEFQEYLYEENIKMLKRLPQLRGTTPWILADFHSPRRQLPEIQGGWNRKGLISETGDRKKAFYVMQKFYQEMAGK